MYRKKEVTLLLFEDMILCIDGSKDSELITNIGNVMGYKTNTDTNNEVTEKEIRKTISIMASRKMKHLEIT